MNGKEKKSFDVIVYSMMIVAVVYAIVQTMLGHNNDISFKIVLGLWILIAVMLTDYVEPMVNKSFDGMTSQKIKQYAGCAITDSCAYICMYMFVINAGFFKEPVHYIFLLCGIILFVVKSMIYKQFRKKDVIEDASRGKYVSDIPEEEEIKVFLSRRDK